MCVFLTGFWHNRDVRQANADCRTSIGMVDQFGAFEGKQIRPTGFHRLSGFIWHYYGDTPPKPWRVCLVTGERGDVIGRRHLVPRSPRKMENCVARPDQ